MIDSDTLRRIELDQLSEDEIEGLFEFDETSAPSADAVDVLRSAVAPPPPEVPGWVLQIPNQSTAAQGVMGAANRRTRRQRQRRYARRAVDFTGIRVVAEGDSWFQYPTRLRDVIDHLSDDDGYNIYSQAFAGDWLSNIVRHHEYMGAIEYYRPQVFLISGGGNDLVGKARLSELLGRYSAGRPPAAYLGADFQAALDDLERLYRFVYDEVTAFDPGLLVLSHCYDYGIPNDGKWLGGPMASIGIVDPDLQQRIVGEMIDRYGDMKARVARDYDRVVHVETRDSVKDDWYDELHPNHAGFGEVARRFAKEIEAHL